MALADKPKTPRQVAELIVELRRLLIQGRIAELKGDVKTANAYEWSFSRLAARLPVSVQMNAGLILRVSAPAERKIEREGWLAQNGD